MDYIIEIATADYTTTKSAVEGGADRIELCAALSEGGTTPSYGTIKKCREKFSVELFPIIRPRGGDFLYSNSEFETMKSDVTLCKELGCDGIVTGMLTRTGHMDMDRIQQLIQLAYPLGVTIHRAFDRCIDPFEALEQLIRAGCQRILTSGQQVTAMMGIQLIADLVKAADGNIIIMPGSGIRADNIYEIQKRTGAIEFHSSLRTKSKSRMDFLHPAFAGQEDSYSNPGIQPESVKALRQALS